MNWNLPIEIEDLLDEAAETLDDAHELWLSSTIESENVANTHAEREESSMRYVKREKMSDLPKRLRAFQMYPEEVMYEAADALEAKDAEIERLTVRNKNQCERLDQQIKHNAKLQAVVDTARAYEAERYHDTWRALVIALAKLDDDDE